MYKKLKQSVENERWRHWVKVINLIQSSDIVHKSLWEKDKQDNGGTAYWSCQSPMYWSVSLNSLLGGRGNQPDNTKLHIPLSPVRDWGEEQRRGRRGQRNRERDTQTKGERHNEHGKKKAHCFDWHRGAQAYWGICSVGSIFRCPPFKAHTTSLCNPCESIFNGKVGEAGRPSLAAVALLRSVWVCVCAW